MNDYEVIGQIGEGAFGKAFLVQERQRGNGACRCVVKEVDLRKMSAREKQSASHEVALLSSMKHGNIVSFFRSFQEAGKLYIVMEFCDGGDLMRRINQQVGLLLPEEQILDWFLQICLGLKHIHDRKVLHRDIKTQNIFLTNGGKTVKLGDFGIARTLKSTMEMARTCVGTPCYLSPEICQSRPYNNKTDIWSLGCVLYELCRLRPPFDAAGLQQLLSLICKGRYQPLASRYSCQLHQLVAQLLRVEPRQRPSVTSVLQSPLLEQHLRRHLDPQALQCNRAAAADNTPRGRPPGGAKRILLRPVQQGAAEGRGRHRFDTPSQQQQHGDHLDAPRRRNQELQPAASAAPQELQEPHQLVAAARREYLHRRREANGYKLRAEKQLGLRPCTAEGDNRKQEVGAEQHTAGDRKEAEQQEYLGQLQLIRQQYQQEVRQRRLQAAAQEDQQQRHTQQRTFVVEKPRRPDSRGQQRATPEQKKGIMFEIHLDEEEEEEEMKEELEVQKKEEGEKVQEEEKEEDEVEETLEVVKMKEELEGQEEVELEKEEEVEPLKQTLDFLEVLEEEEEEEVEEQEEWGEEWDEVDWPERRKEWSQRSPQTLLDFLARVAFHPLADGGTALPHPINVTHHRHHRLTPDR
ncbi:serine/threonine-protein kinase Nek5 isoform X3 [Nelusetta ayraudi]|uniref:serine/threonine-protein kinase Nek5 isoform X3 n=1 Tax=Nelusetta ayraudi TaxID=303726 RepID=UPI003F6E8339